MHHHQFACKCVCCVCFCNWQRSSLSTGQDDEAVLSARCMQSTQGRLRADLLTAAGERPAKACNATASGCLLSLCSSTTKHMDQEKRYGPLRGTISTEKDCLQLTSRSLTLNHSLGSFSHPPTWCAQSHVKLSKRLVKQGFLEAVQIITMLLHSALDETNVSCLCSARVEHTCFHQMQAD